MPTCAAMACAVAALVAGEHDDLEAELLEAGHGRRGARLDRVGDGDRPDGLVVDDDGDDGLALAGERSRRAAPAWPASRSLPATTVWPSTSARMPWPAIASKPVAAGTSRPRSAAAARIAAAERVLAAALGAGHEAQQAVVVEGRRREVAPVPDPNSTTSVTRGLPSVMVPVLSSTTVLELVRRLERGAVADEHAVLGALAGADHDRRRRRQAEGAGARDDEHGDEVEQRVVERRRRAEDEPDDEA